MWTYLKSVIKTEKVKEVIKIFNINELSYFQKMLWHVAAAEDEAYIKCWEEIKDGQFFNEIKNDDEEFVSSCEGVLQKIEKEINDIQKEKMRFEIAANRLNDLLKKIQQQ